MLRKLLASAAVLLALAAPAPAQQLGYGDAYGLAAASLGSATGTMTGYSAGDTITLACTNPSIGSGNSWIPFSTFPVVKVTTVSSGSVTGAIVTTPGVTSGPFGSVSIACSQTSTSGSGVGYNVIAQLGPTASSLVNAPILSAIANLPTISTCGTSPPAASAGSNSNAGQFTFGTGTPTACTVTFAIPYPTQAYCTVTAASSGGAALTGGYYLSAQSKTAFTITVGTGTNSLVWNYTCSGN